jgi:rRNA maturation endonuclease Nob1
MLSIRCTRCRRRLFSAATPRPGVRCPVCGGPIKATDEPVQCGHLAATAPPVQRAEEGS